VDPLPPDRGVEALDIFKLPIEQPILSQILDAASGTFEQVVAGIGVMSQGCLDDKVAARLGPMRHVFEFEKVMSVVGDDAC
jgi:hypothetical protein